MPLVPMQTSPTVTTFIVAGKTVFTDPPLDPTPGQIAVNIPDSVSWMYAKLPGGAQWLPLSGGAAASSAPALWDGLTGVASRPLPLAMGQLLIDTITHRPVAYADFNAAGVVSWVEMESQRTYVGAGVWDSTKLTAPDNYGMPPGTLPDPVANPPQRSDIYINTHTGSITVFN